jgi:peroxiredoxin
MLADGPAKLSTADIFAGRTVVLVGMPGAFTRTCHGSHLPGYVENRDAILARGVDEIAILCVNDHNVMDAWAVATGASGRMLFLADFDASFVRAIGMDIDMSAGGLGIRCRRFSMIARDGVVAALNLETKPGSTEETGAARILELL